MGMKLYCAPARKRHFIRVKSKVLSRVLTAVLFLSAATRLWAQGSTISYQGQLSVSGSPANTNYDFRFAVYDAVTNGNLLSLWQTNAAVPVSNGLFHVALNFGASLFNGASNGSNDWLEVDVRAAGASGFTALTPRQPILPAPYAIFATSASNLLGSVPAAQISGTLSASMLSGAYTNAVNFSNGTFAGAFAGNGAGLTNLNAASLSSGTVADARLSANVALLSTNQTFTGSNTFAGTTLLTNGNNVFQGSFAGNGAGLTNLNAAALASGAALLNTNQTFTGSNTFAGVALLLNSNNTVAGSFFGNGAGLTNLNASALAFGTVANARLSTNVALLFTNQTFTGTNNFAGPTLLTNVNNVFQGSFAGTAAGTFAGNGASLTNLNASYLTNGTVADARLSTNVPLLNTNQIFTGSNTFAGVATLTNWNNTFQGSFFGNGFVAWNAVAGTSQQAARDHGYMLTNPALTTVILPTSPLTNGDIVRVSGANANGWSVMANSSQTIIGHFASYSNCLPAQMLSGSYTNIAMSADGVRLYMVNQNATGLSSSSDSGETWSTINLSGYFSYVACSANGKIVYAAPTTGNIRKSTDGGATWTTTSITTSGFISCTADGSRLFTGSIACSGNGTCLAALGSGTIYLSNSPASWTTIPSPASPVSCLAASSDCTCLVAGTSPGLLYASANHGATWTALTSTNQYWSGAWMSPDGSKLAAAATTSGTIAGGLYRAAVIPLPNTATTNLTGSFGAAVELQYLGNGQFMPVSSTGTLWAN